MHTPQPRTRAIVTAAALTAALLLPFLHAPRAEAAFLGKRGVIVFTGHPTGKAKSSVWFMNGDGSGLVQMWVGLPRCVRSNAIFPPDGENAGCSASPSSLSVMGSGFGSPPPGG